jgi:hypothetical protein
VPTGKRTELITPLDEAPTRDFPRRGGVEQSCQSVLRHHSAGPAQQLVSQAKFEGSGARTPTCPRAALYPLHEWEGHRLVPQWRQWVVDVVPTGRITLPPGARWVLGLLKPSAERAC